MCQRGLANAGNIFNQQMAAGDQCYDRQPYSFGLAFDYGFDCSLEPIDLVDRARSSGASNGFNVPHRAVCILHCK